GQCADRVRAARVVPQRDGELQGPPAPRVRAGLPAQPQWQGAEVRAPGPRTKGDSTVTGDHPNDKIYIHEFVDINGHNRANYLHHITANWSPIGQEERHQLCYG